MALASLNFKKVGDRVTQAVTGHVSVIIDHVLTRQLQVSHHPSTPLAMKSESLLSSNVPDPSDFPPSTISPDLRSLDRSLRCMICGELFDTPVTLGCGHCYCSLVRMVDA